MMQTSIRVRGDPSNIILWKDKKEFSVVEGPVMPVR